MALLVVCAVLGLLVLPAIASTPVLTIEQEATARSVEGRLIAPCCFKQTLAEHRSELAVRLSDEIRALVAQGATEEQVVGHFLTRYGERILAAPRASGFNLLAYVAPVLALPAGLVLIVVLLRRARKKAPAGPDRVGRAEGQAAADDRLRSRMTEEMARLNS